MKTITKDEEVIESNRLIAEFMGYKYIPYSFGLDNSKSGWWLNGVVTSTKISKSFLCRNHKGLQYHSSWDWLMPVVEKIESMRYKDFWNFKVDIINRVMVEITAGDKSIVLIENPLGHRKINAVWEAMVQFIKWYNSQK